MGQQRDGDRERHWPGWLAEGMRRAVDTAWEEVWEAATGMFSTDEGVQRESALRVLAKVDAPALSMNSTNSTCAARERATRPRRTTRAIAFRRSSGRLTPWHVPLGAHRNGLTTGFSRRC